MPAAPNYEATAFRWDGDTLVGAMPPSRTHPGSSNIGAIFLMKGPGEVRATIRLLQGMLLKARHEMQPPLSDEQIAWYKESSDASSA